jgi:hypothetical protein
MVDWRLRVLGLLAATLALAAPASASGAVTIGSDLAPDPDISPGCMGIDACTVANFSHPGLQVSSPIDGVVVRWRVRARTPDGQGVRLKVVRSVGGGAYLGVNTSATRNIPVSTVVATFTFQTRQPITMGDLVALDIDGNNGSFLVRSPSEQPGVTFARWQPPLLDGQERAPLGPFGPPQNEHMFNADVEPDEDGDGFGDETQDQCPTDASTQGACPPDDGTPPPGGGTPPPGGGTPPPGGGTPPPGGGTPSNDFSFGKVKKNKDKGTAKLTVNVPGAGELDLAKTKKVKPDEESAEDAGKDKLSIKPKGKAKQKLNAKGKAKVKANVTYTPDGGTPNTEGKKIKLVKR